MTNATAPSGPVEPLPGQAAAIPLVTKDTIADIAMEVLKGNGYAGYSPDTLRLGMMVTAMGKLQRLYEHDHAATAERVEALEAQLAQDDNDWLAMLRLVATLDEIANPADEWGQADDDTLREQFDPWQALRGIGDLVKELTESRRLLAEAMPDEIAEILDDALITWTVGKEAAFHNGHISQQRHSEARAEYDKAMAWLQRRRSGATSGGQQDE